MPTISPYVNVFPFWLSKKPFFNKFMGAIVSGSFMFIICGMLTRYKIVDSCFLSLNIFNMLLYLFLYLAVSGLSCGMQDLCCSVRDLLLRHVGSFVAACRLQSTRALQLWYMGSRARGLSSCSMRAQLTRGMWDLSSPTRDRTRISCIGRRILNHWTTREVPVSLLLLE